MTVHSYGAVGANPDVADIWFHRYRDGRDVEGRCMSNPSEMLDIHFTDS